MLNALLAVLLVAPLFGMLGTMVVNNRMAFFRYHRSFRFNRNWHWCYYGVKSTPLGDDFICCFMAVTISLLKEYTLTSTDTVIGVFSCGCGCRNRNFIPWRRFQ